MCSFKLCTRMLVVVFLKSCLGLPQCPQTLPHNLLLSGMQIFSYSVILTLPYKQVPFSAIRIKHSGYYPVSLKRWRRASRPIKSGHPWVICHEPLCGSRPSLCLRSSTWILQMTDKGGLVTTLFQEDNTAPINSFFNSLLQVVGYWQWL